MPKDDDENQMPPGGRQDEDEGKPPVLADELVMTRKEMVLFRTDLPRQVAQAFAEQFGGPEELKATVEAATGALVEQGGKILYQMHAAMDTATIRMEQAGKSLQGTMREAGSDARQVSELLHGIKSIAHMLDHGAEAAKKIGRASRPNVVHTVTTVVLALVVSAALHFGWEWWRDSQRVQTAAEIRAWHALFHAAPKDVQEYVRQHLDSPGK